MSNDKVKIYLASPLFNISEQIWNEIVVNKLRHAGFDVYNPQSDNTANDKDNENVVVSAKSIFDGDTNAIIDSNIIIANIDGLCIDPGLAAECGIFWSLHKNNPEKYKGIIGYRSDIRKYGEGDQRFYFNQYIVGLINDIGEIVDLNVPEDKLNINQYNNEVEKVINAITNLL